MIRKAIIVILITLAVAAVVLGIASYHTTIRIGNSLLDATAHWWNATFSAGRLTLRLWVMERQPLGPGEVAALRKLDNGALVLRRPTWSKCRRWPLGVGYYVWGHDFPALQESPPVRLVLFAFEGYMPFWVPFVLLATYPTIAFIRGPLRRYRRRRKGLCVGCGYDLTGNVTGVCSECGQPIGDGEAT